MSVLFASYKGVLKHHLKRPEKYFFFEKMSVFLGSYVAVWKRQIYCLVKRFCVSLETYIVVSKRLHMGVFKRLHMGVSKRLPIGVSKRLHMGVSKHCP